MWHPRANLNTLISKIIVAKLNSCVKMVFWFILLWRHCPNKKFSFVKPFTVKYIQKRFEIVKSVL